MVRTFFLMSRIPRLCTKFLHEKERSFSFTNRLQLSLTQSQRVCSLCHQCHQVSSPLLKRTLSILSREESDWKDKEKSSECSSDLDSRERKSTRKESPWRQPIAWEEHMQFPGPQLNWEYLCNPDNTDIIQANISNRKGVGDIHRVVSWFWQLGDIILLPLYCMIQVSHR